VVPRHRASGGPTAILGISKRREETWKNFNEVYGVEGEHYDRCGRVWLVPKEDADAMRGIVAMQRGFGSDARILRLPTGPRCKPFASAHHRFPVMCRSLFRGVYSGLYGMIFGPKPTVLMGWTQPSVSNPASVGQGGLNDHHEEAREGPKMDIRALGDRLGKESVSGPRGGRARPDGGGARASPRQLLPFVAQLRPCLVGMEACGGAHYWAREIAKRGHEADESALCTPIREVE
jgi:hypothetical protein